MKKAQIYKLPLTEDHRKSAKTAQFVRNSNGLDGIIGFISDIDDDHLTIALFHQLDTLSDEAIVVEESAEDEMIKTLLHTALERNPIMYDAWIEASH